MAGLSSSAVLGPERLRLQSALESGFRSAAEPWSEERFEHLAHDVFRYQVAANPVFGRFVHGRGIDPDGLRSWREIPPIPVRAFKEIPALLVPEGPFEAVFRTSGTTGGRRGEHRVRDLSLYRASLLATATSYLRPGLEAQVPGTAQATLPAARVLCLMPSPALLPDSSLCHMAGTLLQAWDDGLGGSFADATWTVDVAAWQSALDAAARDAVPTIVLGTAFSLLAWLDRLAPGDHTVLPPGSVVMETGGYKGRTRSVSKEELYARIGSAIGVQTDRIVSEYGMTEMLSQFYEPVLRQACPRDPSARFFTGPPWVRTQVLDPITLEQVPSGTAGLLSHLDLANLDSVVAILTEDEGVEMERGIRVLGRLRGAEPRGCSLAIDDLRQAGQDA